MASRTVLDEWDEVSVRQTKVDDPKTIQWASGVFIRDDKLAAGLGEKLRQELGSKAITADSSGIRGTFVLADIVADKRAAVDANIGHAGEVATKIQWGGMALGMIGVAAMVGAVVVNPAILVAAAAGGSAGLAANLGFGATVAGIGTSMVGMLKGDGAPLKALVSPPEGSEPKAFNREELIAGLEKSLGMSNVEVPMVDVAGRLAGKKLAAAIPVAPTASAPKPV
jgi:hypothetical protein